MKTTLVNIKNEKCDIKICRLPDNSIPNPPEKGCFGNRSRNSYRNLV